MQYQNNVGSPQRDKALKIQSGQAYQQDEAVTRLNQRADQASNFKHRLQNDHNNYLYQQLSQKEREKHQLQDAKRNDDLDHARRHNAINAQMDQQQKDLKAMQVQAYKEQLDSQLRIKAAYRAAGNMTGVEKKMNKDEMRAYQKYDAKSYSMQPGMQGQK